MYPSSGPGDWIRMQDSRDVGMVGGGVKADSPLGYSRLGVGLDGGRKATLGERTELWGGCATVKLTPGRRCEPGASKGLLREPGAGCPRKTSDSRARVGCSCFAGMCRELVAAFGTSGAYATGSLLAGSLDRVSFVCAFVLVTVFVVVSVITSVPGQTSAIDYVLKSKAYLQSHHRVSPCGPHGLIAQISSSSASENGEQPSLLTLSATNG